MRGRHNVARGTPRPCQHRVRSRHHEHHPGSGRPQGVEKQMPRIGGRLQDSLSSQREGSSPRAPPERCSRFWRGCKLTASGAAPSRPGSSSSACSPRPAPSAACGAPCAGRASRCPQPTSGRSSTPVLVHIPWVKNGCIFSLWLQSSAHRFPMSLKNPAAWQPSNLETARPKNLRNNGVELHIISALGDRFFSH